VAKEAGEGLSIEDLVAPPDGPKHRILRSTERERLVRGMRRSLRLIAIAIAARKPTFRP